MSNTEIQGVGALESYLASSNILQPHLLKNDRTISWDGHIFIYNQIIRKKNFLGKVPVQVKSTKVTEFSGKGCTDNFSKDDLENYFRDGGVIIFVVEIDEMNNSEFFVVSLLPSDLKGIINEINKRNEDSESLTFEHLPKENILKIESVCKNFIINRNKQMSIKDLPAIPLTKTKELLFTVVTDGRPFEQYLLNTPHYLYTKMNEEGVEMFVDKLTFNQIKKEITEEVTIDGEVYYSTFELVTDKRGKSFVFGKKISFDITSNIVNFTISGNLEEQLNSSKFILEFLKGEEISIGGKIIAKIGNNNLEVEKQFTNRYSRLKDIELLLSIFSIDNSRFDLDKVTVDQDIALRFLVDLMVYDKKYLDIPFHVGIQGIRIGNLLLGIIVHEDAERHFRILNLFDKDLRAQFYIGENGPEVQSSPYVGLMADMLIGMDNLDEKTIIQNVTKIEYSELYAQHLNLLSLEFIKAFDATKVEKFINTAWEIIDWLLLKNPNDIRNILNKYQIIRRAREFNNEEIKDLISMKNNDENEILCGISILLENKADVGIYLGNLSEESKNRFLQYPIYTLAEKLNLI